MLPRDVLLVGAAGTGKTFGILSVLHTIAADYPDLRILFCRATRAAMTESVLVTYEQEILPRDGMESIAAGASRRVRQSYRYPNGTEVVLGGLDNPAKILSTAWDIVFVNEAIEATEEAWETLQSRLNRPGRPSWLGYLIGDTNPGDPSHWLRKRGERGLTAIWDTSHRANPRLHDGRDWTEDGRRYLDGLGKLTGSRRKRLLEGLWAAGEGAWFDGFDATTHVSERAEFDPSLPVHLAIDSGPDSAAVFFQARQPQRADGPWLVTVFADYHSFNRGANRVAHDLLDLARTHCGGRLDRVSTDPAGRSNTSIGISVFEEYRRAGMVVEPWPLRPVLDSLALLESFVSVDPPELLVHPRCKGLVEAFANYKRAQRGGQWIERPADPAHPYEDHIDALRGGLVNLLPDGRRLPPKLGRTNLRNFL